MKNTKINEALGMLDDDIITEALQGKKTKNGYGARRIAIIAIAATLAVAMLAATLVFALGGRGEPGASVLPPDGATVIKFMTSSAQIDGKTVYSASGDYYSVEGQFAEIDPESYYVVNGVEIDGKLYEALVGSNDPNRTWAINVSLSPNLYMTEEYIQKEILYWTSKLEASDFEALAGILSQVTGVYDLQAIYEQYKDKYNVEEFYKYFASGTLEKDLLNADVEAITKKVEELWDDCVKFKDDIWANMVDPARAALEALGIEYAEENGCFTIFVTEGELISLEGVEGLKFSKAEDYDIDINLIDPNAPVDWKGITVTKKLSDALAAHVGEDVLYAVLVKEADVAAIVDMSKYESEYLALFGEYAGRSAKRAALEAAAADASKLPEAESLCGADMVADYIKDGAFDSARFDSDTEAMGAKVEEMRSNLYDDNSMAIYDVFASQVRYIEITAEKNVILYVSAEELSALTFEGEYVFNLAA